MTVISAFTLQIQKWEFNINSWTVTSALLSSEVSWGGVCSSGKERFLHRENLSSCWRKQEVRMRMCQTSCTVVMCIGHVTPHCLCSVDWICWRTLSFLLSLNQTAVCVWDEKAAHRPAGAARLCIWVFPWHRCTFVDAELQMMWLWCIM